jgi:hypothetical protein
MGAIHSLLTVAVFLVVLGNTQMGHMELNHHLHPLFAQQQINLRYFMQCCLQELQYSVLERGIGDDGTYCLTSVDIGGWLMKDEDARKSKTAILF